MGQHGRKMVFLVILALSSVLLNIIDRGLFSVTPFLRIGISNIILLIFLGRLKPQYLFAVLFMRLGISSLILGNITSSALAGTLPGNVAALGVALMLYSRTSMSLPVISIYSSIINLGLQISAVSIYLDMRLLDMYRYFFPLAVISGFLTGAAAQYIKNRTGESLYVFLPEQDSDEDRYCEKGEKKLGHSKSDCLQE